MELREIIAKNICELRIDAGLTQLGLAEILNYSDKAVSKWERAESIPDVFMLKRIADYFGVTVDYLLTEEHKKEPKQELFENELPKNRTHAIITFLSVTLVWLIATFLFVLFLITDANLYIPAWMTFIYSIPISALVMLIFNSIWGVHRLNYIIISAFVWTVLVAIYMTLLTASVGNFWLIFLLGIPAQIIIILWSGIGFKRTKPRGNSKKEVEK